MRTLYTSTKVRKPFTTVGTPVVRSLGNLGDGEIAKQPPLTRLPVFLVSTEAIRYLDFHVDLPEGAPPELRDSFDALLAPLLLNSAFAALRAGGPPNARLALRVTDRALANLELNDTDKGTQRCPCSDVVTSSSSSSPIGTCSLRSIISSDISRVRALFPLQFCPNLVLFCTGAPLITPGSCCDTWTLHLQQRHTTARALHTS